MPPNHPPRALRSRSLARSLGQALLGLLIVIVVISFVSLGLTKNILGAKVAFGLAWVFVVPGLLLTFYMLPAGDPRWLLRAALTPTLSFATEPIALFFVGRLGAPITIVSASLVAGCISLVAVTGLFFMQRSIRRQA